MKYSKNNGGKRNSKLSPRVRRNITIFGKKGAMSSSIVKKGPLYLCFLSSCSSNTIKT